MATVKTGESADRRNYRAQFVCERPTGKPVETYSNRAMLVGTEREPDARALYQVRTRRLVDEAGFVRIEGMAAGASPDGLVGDDGCSKSSARTRRRTSTICACRSANARRRTSGRYRPDARYWPGMVRFRVVSPGVPGELQIVIRRVQRDQQALAKLVMGLGKFLEEVDAEEAELRAMMTKVAA